MKLGILAYASDTGLGNQTKAYVDNLNPHKVMAVDISMYNKMPIHEDWYPNAWRWIRGFPTFNDCEAFLDDLDVVLVAETPLNFHLFAAAKSKGVKVVQHYNYEFLDYFRKPHLPTPALLAAPTKWNIDIVKDLDIAPVKELTVPVDRKEIPFRSIRKGARTFVHIIGRPAVHDRNGTIAFIDAAELLGNDLNYIIYLQTPTDAKALEYFAPVAERLRNTTANITIRENVDNYQDLYAEGEVLVLPRKYGGLCLPAQEALAAGMPVIMSRVSPNEYLNDDWLVDANLHGHFVAHTDIGIYEVNAHNLAKTMSKFTDTDFMKSANQQADSLANYLSWETQKNEYFNLFESLI